MLKADSLFVSLAVALLSSVACVTTGGDRSQSSSVHAARAEAAMRRVEPMADPASDTIVLQGATVLTAVGKRYHPGYVVVEKGRIAAIGEGVAPASVKAPRVDLKGYYITPGLIDTHSHLGVYATPHFRAHSDGNEMTGSTTPGVWAAHSFWPQDPGLETAVAGGVTTIGVLPGSANLIGGRGVTLRTMPHRGARAMRFPGAPEIVKMACGENPKRVYGKRKQAPATRMANVRDHRKAFIAARKYMRDVARRGDETTHDPAMETLAGVLDKRFLLQVHCYRADDILAFVQMAEEFGFEVRSFHHGLEAYKVRDVLAARDISVSTWADWWGYKIEMFDGIPENAALVHDAGARAIIHSDSRRDIQRLNQEASKAYQAGLRAGLSLTEDDALSWITRNPAWALGIDDQVGSLEIGKRADLVVWDAHPLSVYAAARWVFVDGALRYDRAHKTEPWSDFELGQDVTP